MVAGWEKRVTEGSAADEVTALLPFFLLDSERKKNHFKVEASDKIFIESYLWKRQQTEEFMSQLIPTYIYRPLKSVRANAWVT